MKNLIALLLTLSAGGLFYTYVGPTYEEIKALRIEKAEYDEALTNSQKVTDARKDLLEKYNSFAPNDLKRLEKFLPNYVDNIRLIIEVDNVASRYNMILKNVKISVPAAPSAASDEELSAAALSYGTTKFSFDVSGSYEAYRSFVKDLEYSLRMIDITGISFETEKDTKEAKNGFEIYDFTTSLQTYWLKQK